LALQYQILLILATHYFLLCLISWTVIGNISTVWSSWIRSL